MNNNQSAINTAGLIILLIEGAAMTICCAFWFKEMCHEIGRAIKSITTKKDAP
jgi:hypothetical protein